MTEFEWLQSDSPFPMLVYLQGDDSQGNVRMRMDGGTLADGPSQRITPGQLRSFAGACCQRLTSLPLNEVSQQALAAFRRYTRGDAPRAQVRKELEQIETLAAERRQEITIAAAIRGFREDDASSAADCASSAVWQMAWDISRDRLMASYGISDPNDLYMWGFDGPPDRHWRDACAAETAVQAGLLREVVGNPFQPRTVDPGWLAWRGATIARIAELIHSGDSFELLPVLADALEEAGCTDAWLLGHCRVAEGHVPGCWAVESLRSENAPRA